MPERTVVRSPYDVGQLSRTDAGNRKRQVHKIFRQVLRKSPSSEAGFFVKCRKILHADQRILSELVQGETRRYPYGRTVTNRRMKVKGTDFAVLRLRGRACKVCSSSNQTLHSASQTSQESPKMQNATTRTNGEEPQKAVIDDSQDGQYLPLALERCCRVAARRTGNSLPLHKERLRKGWTTFRFPFLVRHSGSRRDIWSQVGIRP